MSISPPYSPELQNHLTGKHLLAFEIPFSQEILTEHLKNGYVSETCGVQSGNGSYHCVRCGNIDQTLFYTFPCKICNQDCTYCRSCIMMGRVSECAKLYRWTGPGIQYTIPDNVMRLTGTLSAGQQNASDCVVEAVNGKDEFLVWAVCGAGKTEVLFPAIEAALLAGKRICLATPRTDVVLELSPRLKKAFPAIEVTTLHAGSEDRHGFSPLTVSTTHQLFRFIEAFDVIIVDEVDAFPYAMDDSLHYAVNKSKKVSAATIYLTATPSKSMRRLYRSGKLKAFIIPARYHRQPIPVPEMKWSGNWQKLFLQQKIPSKINAWVSERLNQNIPFLLFFPSIRVMEQVLPLFQRLSPELSIVHSRHPDRKEKVMALRNGLVPGLLTTTILERGVTIERLEVAVIGAEHEVFSDSALVQIAGRVGRSFANPSGTVTFFHYGKSEAMAEAVHHIQMMNKNAMKRGLLDE
ncbi:DEAD/DEAH box helicase [Peribacillus frigoritolerans]|uniref:DEAD/DEAH box helicase n=1 Tax=Peribacillus frigoritolerans TaxID=450367 RepID=UPI0023DC8C93|nr:DEAD/DEAH box helicase [Peribacillus frigoritolerans]MDF1999553.1 DEAD/DEAH box helicase [Peribacillus frigoritolerans]